MFCNIINLDKCQSFDIIFNNLLFSYITHYFGWTRNDAILLTTSDGKFYTYEREKFIPLISVKIYIDESKIINIVEPYVPKEFSCLNPNIVHSRCSNCGMISQFEQDNLVSMFKENLQIK